jgi:transglutaminase-like putative cysteine protease
MRIRVRHETRYAYRLPAQSALQLMRLTPRSCDNQFVRRWRVEIDADARLEKSEDAFGNITHVVFIEGPIEHVRVMIEGEVDTVDLGGFIKGTVERQPERLFLRPTPLTEPSAQIKTFAKTALAGEGGDLLAALHKINGDLHQSMTFLIGATTAATTAAEAYAARTGVCQDFAHVFVAAARALGVPARYVSGYYLRTDQTEQEAGHAWVEAHLPALGWIGFDPAQGLCVTPRYVRVAIGADSREAAPVRGAQTGGRDEALSVAIDVSQGREIVDQ